jgi:hypothetical protein
MAVQLVDISGGSRQQPVAGSGIVAFGGTLSVLAAATPLCANFITTYKNDSLAVTLLLVSTPSLLFLCTCTINALITK